jgi:zinc D-Ala-D-Ala carboxypeptidase
MRLTENFTLEEFLTSQTATRAHRIVEAPPAVVENLTRLAAELLEPVRAALGPVFISSGYRPAWLNDMIGGAPNSQHMTGCAADINVSGLSPLELAQKIRAMRLAPLNQLILEFPPNGWVHLSVAESGQPAKGKYLTARVVNHRTVYSVGLSDYKGLDSHQ